MKLVAGITTFDRIANLKRTLESWERTRSSEHEWTLIIADDGSTDGTWDYVAALNMDSVRVLRIQNQRRGLHHQTNCILRLAAEIGFDLGFKFDDDLIFRPGWDAAYIAASSQAQHLVLHDPRWKPRCYERYTTPKQWGTLQCLSPEVQGAFWTFTPELLELVGFFDVAEMGLCGIGHQDYTRRAQRVGLAGPSLDCTGAWDVGGSQGLLELLPWAPGGMSAGRDDRKRQNTAEEVERKRALVRDESRQFITYRPALQDMAGMPIRTPEVAVIVPIRGRHELRAGLVENLRTVALRGVEFELIFVEQADSLPFCRGQLCNLGFATSTAPIVVFHDVDIRHTDRMPHNVSGGPVCPWNEVEQAGQILKHPHGWGAVTVLSREQFIAAGGYSNLPIGWGAEDNILAERAGVQKLPGRIVHLPHESCRNEVDAERNRRIYARHRNYRADLDGWAQTRAQSIDLTGITMRVAGISVVDGYAYAADRYTPPCPVDVTPKTIPPPACTQGTESVAIIVPVPDCSDALRWEIWERLRLDWELLRADQSWLLFEVQAEYDEFGQYHKAATMNCGIQAALSAGATAIICADADIFTDPDETERAVRIVTAGKADFAIPAPTVRRLARGEIIGSDNLERPPYQIVPGGGLFVLSRRAAESIKFNETFTGWGGEDIDFGQRVQAVFGEAWRGTGTLWHWWHPKQQRCAEPAIAENEWHRNKRKHKLAKRNHYGRRGRFRRNADDCEE